MKVLQIVALLALVSQAMAQGWCAAPTLKCLSTGTWTSSLAVEVSLASIPATAPGKGKWQSFTIEAFTDKGSWCKATVTPCTQDTVAFWFGPAPAGIAPWTAVMGSCSNPVPCGTQFVITVKNADGQMSITTCNSPACPAVSAPPPCVTASPPPYCASPPPVTVASPPPCVASPPPYVCSPPPVTVSSPPPCVASPPPCVASPPPVTVSSPPPCVASPPPYCMPKVNSPPPYCQSPVTVSSPPPKCYSPVTVSSPPPKCYSPVTVSSPPPYCQSPVTVSSPPPKCQSPVTIYNKPPPYCGPQCGVTKWGKPVYCKPGKKCCTVTVKKWHGKHCETYTKQECMKKCPKH